MLTDPEGLGVTVSNEVRSQISPPLYPKKELSRGDDTTPSKSWQRQGNKHAGYTDCCQHVC